MILPAMAHPQALFPGEGNARRSRTYDVLHYKLIVSFDESLKKVIGTTFVNCTPLAENLDSLVLDAVAMNVTSVSLSVGRPLRFDNRSPELIVHLDRPYSAGDTLTVVIEYTCFPKKGLYFVQPDSGNPRRRHQIWTQGEDMDNRYWFPCYDYPNDKATSEVIATVRESYTVVSNGRLLSEKHDKNAKTRTFHWRQGKPHASYLIMLAAGEYTILEDSYRNIPLQYYVYKEDVKDAPRSFGCTPKAMKFFEEKIGYPYPWEKYAQIVVEDFMWGGMENTSAVTVNEAAIVDERAALDFSNDNVVAHELAHQWWGDVVTCRDWSQLWLNEGFATYFEDLFRAHELGTDELQYELFRSAEGIKLVDQSLGRKPIVNNDSYATNLYNRGAWVIHMLHNILGDRSFWRSLKYYIRRHEFGNVDTHELELAIEDATGQNLQWFFEQWVFKAGYPRLSIRTSWNDEERDLAVDIAQTQITDSLTGVFRMPLDIECTTSRGKQRTSIWLTQKHQVVHIPLDKKPLMVIVDKGQNVLKSLDFEKTREEFMYQLQHAADLADRIDAARELGHYAEDSTVAATLKASALHDAFWGVRREATLALRDMSMSGVKDDLLDIEKDRDSRVRNAAIRGLTGYRTADVSRFLESVADVESSYVVLASCIEVLADVDSLRGYELARRYVDTNSYRDIVRRAALSVLAGMHDGKVLPYAAKYSVPGNSLEIRSIAIRILGEIAESDTTVRPLVMQLASDGISAIRKSAVRILGEWGGNAVKNLLERRKMVEQDEEVMRAIDAVLNRIHG
jgi:aminopeptidase N